MRGWVSVWVGTGTYNTHTSPPRRELCASKHTPKVVPGGTLLAKLQSGPCRGARHNAKHPNRMRISVHATVLWAPKRSCLHVNSSTLVGLVFLIYGLCFFTD